jgi:hypothetical protein
MPWYHSTISTCIVVLTAIYLILFVCLLVYLRLFHSRVWVELGRPSLYSIFFKNVPELSRAIQTSLSTSRFVLLDNRYKLLADNKLSIAVFSIRIVTLCLVLLWGLLFASDFLFPTVENG